MKKIQIVLLVLMALITFFMFFTACIQSKPSEENNLGKAFASERFQILERNSGSGSYAEFIIYDTETGVEYLYVATGYRGAITPLYNTDGTLLIAPNWID